MRNLCCNSKDSPDPISQFPSLTRLGFLPSRLSFSDAVLDRTLEMAEPIIMKWDPAATAIAAVTSLFYQNRREARDFVEWVNNLHKAMHFAASDKSFPEKQLERAHNLMKVAMLVLQKEFHQILSVNRARLDPESISTRSSRTSTRSSTSGCEEDRQGVVVEEESVPGGEIANINAAMSDLRLIADCMTSSGYAKECVKVFKIIRKSIVDEGIYRLGVEKFNASHMHKMKSEGLETRIKNWLNAVGYAVKSLFNGERILCDHVFASSDSIRQSCFAEIIKDGAMVLFAFPENFAKSNQKSPERIFRGLDMYAIISDHWPEIESIFSFHSTASIKSKVKTSLLSLGEYIRTALHDFESAIQKDSSKTLIAGAGIHYITIDVMNYLSLLSDYVNILSEILANSPRTAKNPFLESYCGFPHSDYLLLETPISRKISWLLLILLCKLDAKSMQYNDVALCYLFLANNLQHVTVKIRASNLKNILHDEWVWKHEEKAKQFASNYERVGWGHVVESLPSDPSEIATADGVKEMFAKFNCSFEKACRKYSVCVVPDNKLRDDIKDSIARKICRLYREFYYAHRSTMERDRNSACLLRFTPEDVMLRLSDLFLGYFFLEAGTTLTLS